MGRSATKPSTKRSPKRATAPVRFADIKENLKTRGNKKNAPLQDDQAGDGIGDLMSALKSNAKNARSKPGTFGKEKQQVFEQARQKAAEVTKSGLAHMDVMKQELESLKKQEVGFAQKTEEMKSLWEAHTATIQALIDVHSTLSDNLFTKRQEETNEAAKTVQRHPTQRETSLKTFLKHANTHLERGRENQKVANDARALIKHYKALLLC